jgi:G:T/U-mismatch repair DNA glycosylase
MTEDWTDAMRSVESCATESKLSGVGLWLQIIAVIWMIHTSSCVHLQRSSNQPKAETAAGLPRFLGRPAFSAIFGRKLVSWGKQDVLLGGSKTWVLPNPSGLNRFFSLDQLVRAYSELRIALDRVSK